MHSDTLLSWVLNGKYIYIAKNEDGDILGFATVDYRAHQWAPVWIRALCIRKSMRRAGIGTQLLKAILKRERSGKFLVEYWSGRPKWLRKFYEKLGFRITHERDHRCAVRYVQCALVRAA